MNKSTYHQTEGKIMRLLIIIFMIFLPNLAKSESYLLQGQVLTYGSNGQEVPLPDVGINVLHRNVSSVKTNQLGEFVLSFEKYRRDGKITLSGRKIKISLSDPGWVIATPYQGEFFLPKDLDNEPLTIRVVSNNSTLPVGKLDAIFVSRKPAERDSTPQYTIQVFNTMDKNKAFAIENELNYRGYQAFQTTAWDNGAPVYKIFAGRFISYDEALRSKTVISYLGYRDAFIKPLSR